LRKTGKRIIHFYNYNGSLNNTIKFLENIQKKINFLSLNISVEGNDIKVTLYGERGLQRLAIQRLKEFAHKFL